MIEISFIGVAALIFGIAMPSAISFHLVRMYREKSSKGQSVWAPAVMNFGSFIWLTYGIEIGDLILQLTNITWIVFQSTLIGFILYYRDRPPKNCIDKECSQKNSKDLR